MDKLLSLLKTFGPWTCTPKGLTVFNPTSVDTTELTALATPLGYAVRVQQAVPGTQYYDESSRTMKDCSTFLQVGKPTVVSDDDAKAHLQSL